MQYGQRCHTCHAAAATAHLGKLKDSSLVMQGQRHLYVDSTAATITSDCFDKSLCHRLGECRYHRIPAAFKSLCEAFPDPNLMGKLDTAESHALMEKLAGRCVYAGEELGDRRRTWPVRLVAVKWRPD